MDKETKNQISKEDEAFLKGNPTRLEICNYINNLMENEYMPKIVSLIQSANGGVQLGIMVLQSLLISNHICTGEEIEATIKEFLKAKEQESKKEENKE